MEPEGGNALKSFNKSQDASANTPAEIASAARKVMPRFMDPACQQIIVAKPSPSTMPETQRSHRGSSSSKFLRNRRRGRVLTARIKGHRQNKRVVAQPRTSDCKAGIQ